MIEVWDYELARILKTTAFFAQDVWQGNDSAQLSLRDINGNRVGELRIEEN